MEKEKNNKKRKPNNVDGFVPLSADPFLNIEKKMESTTKKQLEAPTKIDEVNRLFGKLFSFLIVIILFIIVCAIFLAFNRIGLQDQNTNSLSLTHLQYAQQLSLTPNIPPPRKAKHKLVPISRKDVRKIFDVQKSEYIHSGQDDGPACYKMKSQDRGVLFIVNNIDFPDKRQERLGAYNDTTSLLDLFLEFGYECFSYNNLTKPEFFDIVEELKNSEYLKKTESFFLVLMSHGGMEHMHDIVVFSDGAKCKLDEIVYSFTEEKCKCLKGKPKVMVFPFCRNEGRSRGDIPAVVSNTMSALSDTLVCYGTVKGFTTPRHPQKGNWYIQEFCKILAEHAQNKHLEDMIKMIGKVLYEKKLQTASFSNHGFFNHLYINPGI